MSNLTNFDELFNFIMVTENNILKYLSKIKSKFVVDEEPNIDMIMMCCPCVLS